MSTELEVPTCLQDKLTLTQFWGGEEKGISIQITLNQQNASTWSDSGDYVQLTVHEAGVLADQLNTWAQQQHNKKNGIT